MLEYFGKWNNWLGQRMYLVVLTGLFAGFMTGVPAGLPLGAIAIGLFAYATFITALGTSFREFLAVLSRPWVPLWILCLIHILTPLMAWMAGLLFYPHDYYTRLGYLIGASVPIGVTSILWAAIAKGNVAIALVAVTLDTIIVPAFLPLFFKVVIGQTLSISYAEMAHQMLWMITVPSLAGMLLNDISKGSVAGFAQTIGGFTSKLTFALVIFINAAVVGPEIHWSWSILETVMVSFLMVSAGYLIGYAGSFVLKDRSRETAMAIIYCVGLRNISFGLVLVLSYFPAPVSVPITMFMLFQQPLAAIVPHALQRFKRPGDAADKKE